MATKKTTGLMGFNSVVYVLCFGFMILFHKHFCYFVALFFDEDAVRWVGNFNALQVVVFDRRFFVLNRCFFDACSCEAE